VLESKDDILALKKTMEAAKLKYDLVRENEGMAAKKKEMGHQLAWAQVQDVENDLNKKVEYVAEVQREIDDAERTLGDKDASFQVLEQSLERLRDHRRQLEEEMDPVKAEEATTKEAYDDAANAVKANRNETKKLSDNVAKAKQNVAKCKRDIETENRRLEDANGGANARKLAEIDNAKQQVIEAKSNFDTHSDQRSGLGAKRDEAQKEVKRLENLVGNKRRECQEAEQQLASLNSNRGDKMAGFDREMPKLLQAIQREQRFREKPIGPMGLHIKLRDPKWSGVLEAVLNSVLTSFLVTSKADQVLLSDILVSDLENTQSYFSVLIKSCTLDARKHGSFLQCCYR
jgi:chromosome segregation ATPase